MVEHNVVTVRLIHPFTEGGHGTSASEGRVGDDAIKGEENGSDEIEDEEVARRPRIARRPQMPTKAEVDAHMVLHADYRDWCPDCVAGRGFSPLQRATLNSGLGLMLGLDTVFPAQRLFYRMLSDEQWLQCHVRHTQVTELQGRL